MRRCWSRSTPTRTRRQFTSTVRFQAPSRREADARVPLAPRADAVAHPKGRRGAGSEPHFADPPMSPRRSAARSGRSRRGGGQRSGPGLPRDAKVGTAEPRADLQRQLAAACGRLLAGSAAAGAHRSQGRLVVTTTITSPSSAAAVTANGRKLRRDRGDAAFLPASCWRSPASHSRAAAARPTMKMITATGARSRPGLQDRHPSPDPTSATIAGFNLQKPGARLRRPFLNAFAVLVATLLVRTARAKLGATRLVDIAVIGFNHQPTSPGRRPNRLSIAAHIGDDSRSLLGDRPGGRPGERARDDGCRALQSRMGGRRADPQLWQMGPAPKFRPLTTPTVAGEVPG